MAYASQQYVKNLLGQTLKAAQEEGLLGGGGSSSNGSDLVPIGTIISFMGNEAPKNYLVCDGTEYEIVKYPDLTNYFKKQFGTINKFGGDGVTTFAVPNLTDRFLKGSIESGVLEEAGLPDITGTTTNGFHWSDGAQHQVIGAFTLNRKANDSFINTSGNDSSTTSKFRNTNMTFKASDSNDIYGKSTTVTPDNMSVLYCIKVSNAEELPLVNNYLSIDKYTEDEICIGEYMGKPLYRKCINLGHGFSLTAGQDKDFTIYFKDLNIDVCLDGTVITETDNNNERLINHFSNIYSVNNGQTWKGHSVSQLLSQTNRFSHFMVEYTKTTDEDNSFNPSMVTNNISINGVSYENYSNEEIVIGKWIDGKPLYRKVIEINGKISDGMDVTSWFQNIDQMVKYDAIGGDTNVYKWSQSACTTSRGIWFNIDYTILYTEANSARIYDFIMFEYTKTTDEPNSFTPDMMVGNVIVEEATADEVKEVLTW